MCNYASLTTPSRTPNKTIRQLHYITVFWLIIIMTNSNERDRKGHKRIFIYYAICSRVRELCYRTITELVIKYYFVGTNKLAKMHLSRLTSLFEFIMTYLHAYSKRCEIDVPLFQFDAHAREVHFTQVRISLQRNYSKCSGGFFFALLHLIYLSFKL